MSDLTNDLKLRTLSLDLSALTLVLNSLLDRPEVAQAFITANKAEVVEGYVSEMLRIDPPVPGVYRTAKASEVVGSTSVKDGDLVYLDIASANKNVCLLRFSVLEVILMRIQERAFPEPSKINHSRPEERYIRGDVLTRTLGTELVSKIIHKTLQAVFELKNVTRVLPQSDELPQSSEPKR